MLFKDDTEREHWKEMFTPSDTVVAHHELYNELKTVRPDVAAMLPKFYFYSANFEVFGQPTEKDENGLLGYRLHFTPKPVQQPLAEAGV